MRRPIMLLLILLAMWLNACGYYALQHTGDTSGAIHAQSGVTRAAANAAAPAPTKTPCARAGQLCGPKFLSCCGACGPGSRCIDTPPPVPTATGPTPIASPSDRDLPPKPSYQDVSDRHFRDAPGNGRGHQFNYYRGHVASQTEQDAMMQKLVRDYLPEAIRFARTLPTCASDVKFAVISGLTSVTAKLGTNYELKSICPKGDWSVHKGGRHYAFPNYAIARLRACLIRAGTACSTSPLFTTGMADLFDLNRDCKPSAAWVTPKTGPYDPVRANDGLVSTTHDRTAPLTAQDKVLLHATHTAHAWSTDFNNGDRPDPPPAGLVGQAHTAFEAACPHDSAYQQCLHKRRPIDFSGAMDSTWGPAEQRTLRTLQDEAHARWMVAQEKGDWCSIRGEDENHSIAHVCAALKHPLLEVRPYRPDCAEACLPITCEQLIQQHGQTPGSPPM